MEKGIKYLRELAVGEIIHSDTQRVVDNDEVPYTLALLQKVVQSAPSTYACSLAIFKFTQDEEAVTVGEVADKM